jgi:hypothetical protein
MSEARMQARRLSSLQKGQRSPLWSEITTVNESSAASDHRFGIE